MTAKRPIFFTFFFGGKPPFLHYSPRSGEIFSHPFFHYSPRSGEIRFSTLFYTLFAAEREIFTHFCLKTTGKFTKNPFLTLFSPRSGDFFKHFFTQFLLEKRKYSIFSHSFLVEKSGFPRKKKTLKNTDQDLVEEPVTSVFFKPNLALKNYF